MKSLGGGLSRDAYGTSVELRPDPEGRSGAYVALIPNRHADPDYGDRITQEAEVLRALADVSLNFRAPRIVALIEDRKPPILIQSFVSGIVVDLRAGRQPICPWELVADLAAAIHAVPPPPTWPTRTCAAHRLEVIKALESFTPHPEPLITEALAWMRAHPGDPTSGVLLHGDLLGHNLRIHPSDTPGVIDWHCAELGDPGHDLAIVTRGSRRPFQIGGAREKLLDAYNKRSATNVSAESLRFFELALLVHWAVKPGNAQQIDAARRGQIQRLLRTK